MNIYEKIHCITHKLSGVAKTMTVKLPNGSYKAVSEGDVLSAVKPLLDEYKVVVIPTKRETIYGEPFLKYKTKDNGEKVVFYSRVKTTYSIVNLDDPKDIITTECYGDGVDPMDKSIGKAITYCDKYNLLKLFMLITGEDADQTGSVSITDEGNGKDDGLRSFVPSEDEKPASDKQLKYIEALKLQKVYAEPIFRGQFGFWLSQADTNEKARIAISFLQQCPNKPKEEPKADDNGVIVDDDLPF